MKHRISFALTCLVALTLSMTACAMLNPAAVYCDTLGYQYLQRETPEGTEGYCKMPDNSEVEGWKFLKGEEGQQHSYCTQNGYAIKTIEDPEKCWILMTEKCAVCVLPNGTETEVTKLMNLDFRETTCGDGTCGVPENYETCPQDCRSGSEDLLCDGVKDGICDPDCVLDEQKKTDADCTTEEQPTSCLSLISLSLTGIAALLLKIR